MMKNQTPEELHQRIVANRRHATNAPRVTPPETRIATLRTACAGDTTCPKCGGVRQAAQRAAAGPNDAPPPPDVGERIRANRGAHPEHQREAARISGVRTLLRAFIPSPVRDDATLALPEPLVAAAAVEAHRAPAPPSIEDMANRIRQKRGVK